MEKKKKKYGKQIYVADCIEHGERFYSLFMTDSRDAVAIYQFGIDEAAQWGGECIQVVKLEATDIPYPEKMPWDMDISTTENVGLNIIDKSNE